MLGLDKNILNIIKKYLNYKKLFDIVIKFSSTGQH